MSVRQIIFTLKENLCLRAFITELDLTASGHTETFKFLYHAPPHSYKLYIYYVPSTVLIALNIKLIPIAIL